MPLVVTIKFLLISSTTSNLSFSLNHFGYMELNSSLIPSKRRIFLLSDGKLGIYEKTSVEYPSKSNIF